MASDGLQLLWLITLVAIRPEIALPLWGYFKTWDFRGVHLIVIKPLAFFGMGKSLLE